MGRAEFDRVKTHFLESRRTFPMDVFPPDRIPQVRCSLHLVDRTISNMRWDPDQSAPVCDGTHQCRGGHAAVVMNAAIDPRTPTIDSHPFANPGHLLAVTSTSLTHLVPYPQEGPMGAFRLGTPSNEVPPPGPPILAGGETSRGMDVAPICPGCLTFRALPSAVPTHPVATDPIALQYCCFDCYLGKGGHAPHCTRVMANGTTGLIGGTPPPCGLQGPSRALPVRLSQLRSMFPPRLQQGPLGPAVLMSAQYPPPTLAVIEATCSDPHCLVRPPGVDNPSNATPASIALDTGHLNSRNNVLEFQAGIVIQGPQVQGVGMRAWVERATLRINLASLNHSYLTGKVANIQPGRALAFAPLPVVDDLEVVVMVRGSLRDLEFLIRELRIGPDYALNPWKDKLARNRPANVRRIFIGWGRPTLPLPPSHTPLGEYMVRLPDQPQLPPLSAVLLPRGAIPLV